MTLLRLLGLVLLVGVVGADDGRLRVVALLSSEDDMRQDIAFANAVKLTNNDIRHTDILSMEIRDVKPFDSFSIGMITCDMTAKGVAGIFGPQSISSSGIVRSVCETLEIPHIVTTWDPNSVPTQYTNNLYPDPEVLSQGLAEMVRQMKWRSYTVLYQDDNALIRLQGVLQGKKKGDFPIIVRQLDSKDYRPVFKDIQKSTETRIVLDCATEDILDILRAADSVGMMDVYCSYLLTSLDAHTLDYSEFLDHGPNITTMRLIDPSTSVVQNVVRDWVEAEERTGNTLDIAPETLKVETALMYDAVLLYTEAVVLLNRSEQIIQEPLECRDTAKWRRGLEISNFMRLRQIQGLTGLIELDSSGRRTSFLLEIVEYSSEEGFRKVGEWNPIDEYVSTRSHSELDSQISLSLGKRTMIVTSKLGAPFLFKRNQTDPPTLFGNDLFEGYSLDLIDEIARDLKFKYEFRLVDDGQQGKQNAKGEWNGLIGELLNRRADLAICDLTITYEREKAVDFTMPFMNLGISILYMKPEKGETNLFSFLDPFSFDVWMYLVTAALGISITLFITSRMTPYEWDNPHPCKTEPEELENSFNLINCLWFSMGSILGAGCDILPRAVSSRMLAGWWWFFALIMIASYTANLAAFLTVAKMDSPLKGVEDLANQKKIKYGTYKYGTTARFFETSNVTTYQRIWTVMQQTRPEVFTTSSDANEGVDRVKKGKGSYAFFMESTSIEYQMERNCELMKIGTELDSKGYGIALPPDSRFRPMINEAILRLQEGGKLKLLKTRWWKEKGGGACGDETSDTPTKSSDELGLANVGGVFLVLLFGCVGAFLVAVLEMLWNCRKIAVHEKTTPWAALKSELKFAVRCSVDTKPVVKAPESVNENENENENENPELGSFLRLRMNYDKA